MYLRYSMSDVVKKISICSCVVLFLVSCAKLKLEHQPLHDSEASEASSATPEPEDDGMWLVQSVNYKTNLKTSTLKYDNEVLVYEVTVEDLKKGDVVQVFTHFNVSNDNLYKSYVRAYLIGDKDDDELEQKDISIDKAKKYAEINLMTAHSVEKDTKSYTYHAKAKLVAEQSKWNNTANGTVRLSPTQSDLEGIFAVVYRKYEYEDVLNAKETPYYLQKVYFSPNPTEKVMETSCGEPLFSIGNVTLKKNDLMFIQGQVQLLTRDEGDKDSYDYSLSIVNDGSSGDEFNTNFIIPGKKTSNFSGVPSTKRFFAIHEVPNDAEVSLSLAMEGSDCTIGYNQESQAVSVWVFRKVTPKNLKEDKKFYYLRSPEIQDYKTVFSKIPTAVQVQKDNSALLIMSLDVGTINQDDILDIKMDTSFSLDYATDDSHQYDLYYKFKFPTLDVKSQVARGCFSARNTAFDVKQDMSLYFATQATKKVTNERFNLYTTITASSGHQNEYLNVNNFKLVFQQWVPYTDIETLLDTQKSSTGKIIEEEEESSADSDDE